MDDRDCGEGSYCSKPDVACAISPGGEEECDEPEDSEGECVRAPLSCVSDEDCPGVLTCESYGVTNCVTTVEGDEDCEDEPVEEERFCTWRPEDCQTNADCAEGFECEIHVAPGVPCEEVCDAENNCDLVCPDPEMTSGGSCFPRRIECGTNDDCPTDWTCFTDTVNECTVSSDGSGSSGSSGGGSSGEGAPPRGEDVPEPGEDEGGDDDGEGENPVVEEDCEERQVSLCLPPGFEQLVEQGPIGGSDVAEGGSSFDSVNERDDGAAEGPGSGGDSVDSGGCSVASGTGSGLAWMMLASVGGLFLLRRK